ncbi:MAG: asparagine synthase (glutamine-hydrolyzing) [Bacillota bacterium]
MCGIAGWIERSKDLTKETALIEAMGAAVAHRGPDAGATWVSPHAAFAHRRLIVVDPAGGAQPMVRRRGEHTYVLVYNGELYNTEDIRRELAAKGHTFLGYGDTEVLLLAYMEWGPSCLEKLNGIFAFGIWSEADESLFLARDRLGVKPLFYSQRGEALLFGSELKAILAHPAVPREVDAAGLAEVLMLGPARTPGCGVFKGIQELRAGHCLLNNRHGTRRWQYWSLESHPHIGDLKATTERVRHLLEDTVTRQLVSDVPVCSLLSGGLDSSALTALACKALKRAGQPPLHTWSIDFKGNERFFTPDHYQPDADGPWVHRVSSWLGTHHHYVTVDTPELMEALLRSMRANDLPGMADVDSSLYLFCREVKREATVALSGEAADEIFGGYPWFRDPAALEAKTFPWALMTGARIRLLSPEVTRLIRAEEYVTDRYREALDEVPRFPGDTPEEARARDLFYLNITRFMPTLLDRKDRMSMAVGLEVRVPFCDHRLVEYLWNVPWALKACNGKEKGLLRKALEGIVPADVLMRKKSPYPKTHNPSYLAAVRQWVLQVLADPASPLIPLIDVARVRELAVYGGIARHTTWFGQLMRDAQWLAYLAQTDAWLREYHISVR